MQGVIQLASNSIIKDPDFLLLMFPLLLPCSEVSKKQRRLVKDKVHYLAVLAVAFVLVVGITALLKPDVIAENRLFEREVFEDNDDYESVEERLTKEGTNTGTLPESWLVFLHCPKRTSAVNAMWQVETKKGDQLNNSWIF